MHHCFPLDTMTQQPQMIAVKGNHAARHVVHTFYTCSVASVNTHKPHHIFSIIRLAKYALLHLFLNPTKQNLTFHLCCWLQECCEGRQLVVGVMWCASVGFHLPVLWLPLLILIKNIPWNFLTLPVPRPHFTCTLARVFVYAWHTRSFDPLRYLLAKRVVTVKNTHVVLSVLKFEPFWVSLLKADLYVYVLLCRPIIAHCAGRAGPCVLQSLVVLWCWSDDWERDFQACMTICLCGTSSLCAFLSTFSHLTVCIHNYYSNLVLSSKVIFLPVCLLVLSVAISVLVWYMISAAV